VARPAEIQSVVQVNTASLDSKLAQGPTPCASRTAGRGKELIALGLILVACNLHLITGAFPSSTAFLSGRVAAGEWWRVATHAFAHLSWYHLALDGSAFLILYHSLPLATPGARLGVVAASTAGSLAAAVFVDSRVADIGFCGLSGTAHGLMAASMLGEMCSTDRTRRRFGVLVFTGLVAKCIVEAVTGGALFGEFHLGNVGTAIGVCHGGGAVGGLLAGFAAIRRSSRQR
jgi:rhomboid family GlyGly-CTERM serine protease